MLHLDQYVIKEHVGMFKLSDTYDIIDPGTGQRLGIAREVVSGWMHVLRFLVNKQMLPTTVDFIEGADDHGNGKVVLSIRRGFTLFRAKIRIFAEGEAEIGYFKSKLFSLGGGFHIYDVQDRRLGEVKGDWKGWNFKILDDSGKELGVVTKTWAGLGKEFFTSADNYIISLNKEAVGAKGARALLLAAGVAIDTVYKEKG